MPHGELPNRRSAPQPNTSMNATAEKKTTPIDQASPLRRAVSAIDSGSNRERVKGSSDLDDSLSVSSLSKRPMTSFFAGFDGAAGGSGCGSSLASRRFFIINDHHGTDGSRSNNNLSCTSVLVTSFV